MFKPALQQFYSSNQSSSNKSANISLDTSDITAVAQILKDKKNEDATAAQLTLPKPVLFSIKKNTQIAVIFDDTSDLMKLSAVKTALSQTNNQAGLFAESEALYDKIDSVSLNKRSVNIDDIDLSKLSSADAAAIFDGIVALSENNSFRKTKLPEQFQNFLSKNPAINNEMQKSKASLKK